MKQKLTPGQARTARVLLGFLGVGVLSVMGLLGWEFYSLTLPDEAAITTVVRLLYAEEPGAFMGVAAVLVGAAGWLSGHFFWCKCPKQEE